MTDDATHDIAHFEAQNGLQFNDRELLQMAFIHSSYVNESADPTLQDNERLEFLGDSILTYLVADVLYTRFPDVSEGALTAMRAALVRGDTLARYARRLQLGKYLWLGHGEEESGGRERTATLCATFEAVVGAIYLDRGMDAVREYVGPVFEPDLARVQRQAVQKDAKSRLQEWAQSHMGAPPKYQVVKEDGPDHDKLFVTQVTVDKVRYGIGQGRSKQEASQAAAAMALAQLGQEALDYTPDEDLLARWPVASWRENGFGHADGAGTEDETGDSDTLDA